MKNERFFRAYNALVDAYINNTLNAMDCTMCAVGNIVGAACGKKPSTDSGNYWSDGSLTEWPNVRTVIGLLTNNDHRIKNAMHEIEPTGYSAEQIVKIEEIFMDTIDAIIDEAGTWSMQYKENPSLIDHSPALYAVVDYLYSLEDWDSDNTEAKEALNYFKACEA